MHTSVYNTNETYKHTSNANVGLGRCRLRLTLPAGLDSVCSQLRNSLASISAAPFSVSVSVLVCDTNVVGVSSGLAKRKLQYAPSDDEFTNVAAEIECDWRQRQQQHTMG